MRAAAARLAMAVTVCITVAALTLPATAGLTTVRGWRIDGTGLLMRGHSGQLEPMDRGRAMETGEYTFTAAPGYEDQASGFEAPAEPAQSISGGRDAFDEGEWDERGAPEGSFRDWGGEAAYEDRGDDRYHSYADGSEF